MDYYKIYKKYKYKYKNITENVDITNHKNLEECQKHLRRLQLENTALRKKLGLLYSNPNFQLPEYTKKIS